MLRKPHPKAWQQMSRKKKINYMDSVKELYGVTQHAKEGKDAKDAYGERGANKALYLDDQK